MVPKQRGAALIVVLWVVTLISILLGGFALIARSENLQTRYLFDTTRARYAAEAGLAYAAYELRRADPLTRWVPDGRAYEFDFEGVKVKLEITDESGKIDINAADEQVLKAMFQAAGEDEARAIALTDAVMDWRDGDDLVRAQGAEDRDYEAAGYPYGAADFGFSTIGELQQIMGMNFELYRKLEPLITVHSRNGQPNPAFAPPEILQLLPGLTPELARQLVEQRRQSTPEQLAAAPLILPNGNPLVVGAGGVTYTVKSRATLPNGSWTMLDATIRIGGAPGGRAFSVLRWRLGAPSEPAESNE
jgi:general secretion pathway protein K